MIELNYYLSGVMSYYLYKVSGGKSPSLLGVILYDLGSKQDKKNFVRKINYFEIPRHLVCYPLFRIEVSTVECETFLFDWQQDTENVCHCIIPCSMGNMGIPL